MPTIEEYKKFPGFNIDIEKVMEPTSKIFNADDFVLFIDNVSTDNDKFMALRNSFNKKYNYSSDGKNAVRVTDFIVEKCNLIL